MTERLFSLNEVGEGVAGVKNHTKNVFGHRPFFASKMSLFFWFDQMVQKKARSYEVKWEDWVFFWTIWSNQKIKDIFDAKMAYGQQHFLVWFFDPVTPSHTSFSDSSLSVAWSFIRKKLQIAISPKQLTKTFWFLHML